MLQNLFKPRAQRTAGAALYATAVAQARQPDFYTRLGVEDRIDARFELYTAHVLLLLLRLKGAGEEGAEISQALFDAYLAALDDTLRELGVGDLSVSKKMRKLGGTLYARIRAYEQALGPNADPALIEALVTRALFAAPTETDAEPDAGAPEGDAAPVDPRAGPIADYLRRALAALDAQSIEALRAGRAHWPTVIP